MLGVHGLIFSSLRTMGCRMNVNKPYGVYIFKSKYPGLLFFVITCHTILKCGPVSSIQVSNKSKSKSVSLTNKQSTEVSDPFKSIFHKLFISGMHSLVI